MCVLGEEDISITFEKIKKIDVYLLFAIHTHLFQNCLMFVKENGLSETELWTHTFLIVTEKI